MKACYVLHGHLHLSVLVVTLALVKRWLCVVCIQLEEGERTNLMKRLSTLQHF